MELPEIGGHCSVANCGQLDFLPFLCTRCDRLFCLRHRFPTDHACPKNSVTTRTDPLPSHSNSRHTCTMSDCGQQAVVMSLCPHCHQVHCLDHRHPDQHRCSHRDAAPSASSKKPIVDRAWIRDTLGLPASKPTTGYKAPPPARPIIATKECGGPRSRVALMQLKGRAKGDAKIPLGERVYCTVIIRPSQGAAVECPLFFAKRHTIGKVLDVAMSHTAITGVDKQTVEVWAEGSSSPLGKSARLETLLKEGTLHNGGTIVLQANPGV